MTKAKARWRPDNLPGSATPAPASSAARARLRRTDSTHFAVPPPEQTSHWIVPAYHRMRALSCAYTLVFCGLHAWALEASAWMGVALVLQFLVDPHLVARR